MRDDEGAAEVSVFGGHSESDSCEEARAIAGRPGRSQFSALVRSWKRRPTVMRAVFLTLSAWW